MRTQSSSTALAAIVLTLLAAPTYAQSSPAPVASPPFALGEDYHVEASVGFWSPTPDVVVSSSALGRVGTTISAQDDLGIERRALPDFRFVLKPGRRHKFRIAYLPLSWSAEKVITRNIEFNAQLFRVSLPVESELKWQEWSFGYEFDFISNERGFAGLFVDVKYPKVNVTLSSLAVGTEFTEAQAPIPTIGGAGRVYVTPMVAINFELTALKIPQIEDYSATFIDWDLAGIVNFNRNVGARFGYRSMGMDYLFELDKGDMNLGGIYFAGIARF